MPNCRFKIPERDVQLPRLRFLRLGYRDYAETLKLQYELLAQRIDKKIDDTILTVEHPRVITQGRRAASEDFLLSPFELQQQGYSVVKAGRGGKLTYHGPGQLVVYFIISIAERKWTIPVLVHKIEAALLDTLEHFQILGHRRDEFPGIWVQERKIASLGLAIQRGVSLHGAALNVATRLEDFSIIVPCGITSCRMTSMESETSRCHELDDVEKILHSSIARHF